MSIYFRLLFFLSWSLIIPVEIIAMQLSILICTLDERKEDYNRLYTKLHKQIDENELQDSVEIRTFCDNREHSIGYKRNALLNASTGKYVCFIDDDDDVHPKYVRMIYDALQTDPDCVSLVGVITFRRYGGGQRIFIHSIKYDSWFEQDDIYYRPPNHLNPIRRSIAIQFLFPEKNHGEDADWSMQVTRSGLIKTEAVISEPYYYYLFNGWL